MFLCEQAFLARHGGRGVESGAVYGGAHRPAGKKGECVRKKEIQAYTAAGALFALFVLFTVLVATVDRQAIGPEGTVVGFAAVNGYVFGHIGVHEVWYDITRSLGYAVLAVALSFAALGLRQALKRKSLGKVDRSLVVLGLYYLLVFACYLLFEVLVINYRPLLMDGQLEASYPSSHTLMTLCIMAAVPGQLRALYPQKKRLRAAAVILAVVVSLLMILGRILSGVHWLSDMLGSLLLSSALTALYDAVLEHVKLERRR